MFIFIKCKQTRKSINKPYIINRHVKTFHFIPIFSDVGAGGSRGSVDPPGSVQYTPVSEQGTKEEKEKKKKKGRNKERKKKRKKKGGTEKMATAMTTTTTTEIMTKMMMTTTSSNK